MAAGSEQDYDVVVLGAGRAACHRDAHSATIAVAGQVPIARLWHAVPCFPTISELWLRLLEAFQDSSQDVSGR